MIHTNRGRSRGEQKLDKLNFYNELAEGKSSEKARNAYQHKAYSVEGYLKSKGIDVTKGVDAGGADEKDRE